MIGSIIKKTPARGGFTAAFAFVALSLVAGCSPVGVAVGAGATVGVAAAQERSVGNALDDSVITVEINHLLFQKSQDLFQQVGLDVVEGRVLLTGSVPLPENRIEAARLAWQVDGVLEVINEIQVNDQSGVLNFARDTWITTQLSRAERVLVVAARIRTAGRLRIPDARSPRAAVGPTCSDAGSRTGGGSRPEGSGDGQTGRARGRGPPDFVTPEISSWRRRARLWRGRGGKRGRRGPRISGPRRSNQGAGPPDR